MTGDFISASSGACPSCGLGNGVAGAVYRAAFCRYGGGFASGEKNSTTQPESIRMARLRFCDLNFFAVFLMTVLPWPRGGQVLTNRLSVAHSLGLGRSQQAFRFLNQFLHMEG